MSKFSKEDFDFLESRYLAIEDSFGWGNVHAKKWEEILENLKVIVEKEEDNEIVV